MSKILIVDKEPRSREKLERLLIGIGYRVLMSDTDEVALEAVGAGRVDLVILENVLTGPTGLEMLERILAVNPKIPVIMLSDSGATEDVIKAAKLGAFDYLLKPFSDNEMIRVVGMALETGRFMRSAVDITDDPGVTTDDALIGRSRSMREIYKAIGRVAPTDTTILIRGESGTGKELVAKAIYQHSKRANGPFAIVNCVAIPENLLESELFGYEKGAFTGADYQRIGKIERAIGGTVFLDEIGDIPVTIQAKLLRLLQEKTIERIGGTKPIKVDVRVISATNVDLEGEIKEGRFREDLYYRLNVVSLTLPSLRDHSEDIPYLAEYFMAKFSKNLAVRNPGLTSEAIDQLTNHNWPGNVRELANIIEKCLIFSKGRPVGINEVASLVLDDGQKAGRAIKDFDQTIVAWARKAFADGGANLLGGLTDHLARLIIGEALTVCEGNRSRTARLLGISRPTLQYRMEKFNLGRRGGFEIDK